MLIEFVVGQLFLVLFNVTNAYIDAYRILKNKTIAHAINFGTYLVAAGIICFFLRIQVYFLWGFIPYGPALLFFISAFFNRQFSFDIPLNLRRGLKGFYQSTAEKPKALLDRIERAIFGTGEDVGKKILKAYFVCYCVTVILWAWEV